MQFVTIERGFMNKLFLLGSLMFSVSCGGPKADQATPVPAPAPTTKVASEPDAAVAIMRAPLGADGEPDLSKAELRTGIASSSLKMDDASLSEAFTSLGTATSTKVANSVDELDQDSSSQSWFLLPWRARVAAGIPVRSGPYLLPWRRAVANGYPVGGNYLLPFRQGVANAQTYYYYNSGYSGGSY